jgi:Zn-dependent protease/predicted transcriptional regulator
VKETLRLGHVLGIRVGVNWTVLVIFTLVLVGLAAGRFPLTHPDEEPWAYALAGGIAAVTFFLSLLAHELAHAVVARGAGIRVEGITLWLFGGVAKLLDEAKDPRTDLRVAGVGPLVSVLLAAGFALLALLAAGLGIEGLPVGVLWWLSLINTVLAVFNLVPAAPLDGGRILRAILWHRHGDRTRAAVTASRAGRTFGILLIGFGIAMIVTLPGFGGLWFMLIGWFIMTAAGAEEQHAQLQERLGGVRVAQVMSRQLVTVPEQLSVSDLIESFVWRSSFSSFPVVDPEGHPRGLITLNHIKEVPHEQRHQVAVSQVARPMEELVVVQPDTPLTELLPPLSSSSERRALVVEGGALVGLISTTDIARAIEVADLRRPSERSHL